ncbi:MAG: hemolysin III family protein [Clostridiales bacterium]|nr:hemolysin III family protein [Clostridiales bacterium]
MREPINTWTHLITFLLGVAGLFLLVILSIGDMAKLITMTIYGLSVIVLYGASTAYHWVETTPNRLAILRTLDHMSIFILIAGTYTPVLYYGLDGAWKWTMLSVIWGLALLGIILKVFFTGTARTFSTILYIALGWMALIPLFKLIRSLPVGAMVFMTLGGIAYTIGGVIYATKRIKFLPEKLGFHEVFHIFVSFGSVLHFIMIAKYIMPM